jgi:hypothetical protein
MLSAGVVYCNIGRDPLQLRRILSHLPTTAIIETERLKQRGV